MPDSLLDGGLIEYFDTAEPGRLRDANIIADWCLHRPDEIVNCDLDQSESRLRNIAVICNL